MHFRMSDRLGLMCQKAGMFTDAVFQESVAASGSYFCNRNSLSVVGWCSSSGGRRESAC